MKILTIHNGYKLRGGEDESRDAEEQLLTAHGHEVASLQFENNGISSCNAAIAGIGATWNVSSYNRLRDRLKAWRPDIVSVHNFFPIASPSIYYAARECGVPVVQTLHNYRLICPGAILFREGRVCEECVGKSVPFPGVLHGCYRGSRAATFAVAAMLSTHNLLGTWKKQVDMFIALSEFSRNKFVEGGLPRERITVKPNFLASDLGPGAGNGDYVLYVGRLTAEKGIIDLIEAWKSAAPRGRLLIAGEGPLEPHVDREASLSGSIFYLGRLPLPEVYQLLAEARALVFPSVWYEGMPRVILEAFSVGTPVIASRTGSMTEMVADGVNGWLVAPGDVSGLGIAVANLFDPDRNLCRYRTAARLEFQKKYTAGRNYGLLMDIFGQVLEARSGHHGQKIAQVPVSC